MKSHRRHTEHRGWTSSRGNLQISIAYGAPLLVQVGVAAVAKAAVPVVGFDLLGHPQSRSRANARVGHIQRCGVVVLVEGGLHTGGTLSKRAVHLDKSL